MNLEAYIKLKASIVLETSICRHVCKFRDATGIVDFRDATGIVDFRDATGIVDFRDATGIVYFRDATGIVDFRDALELQRDVHSSAMLHKLQNN